MTTREARPPDLEMRVRTSNEHGRTRLIYILHSPTGAVAFSHQEIAGPTFQGSPEEYQARLLHKIEQLGHGFDVDQSSLLRTEIERKLTSLGRDLWRELFPAEIRYAYRDIRRSIRTWMIISDEPWIPWELIKPYEDSRPDEIIDDDFLAFQFELTRWLAGGKTPSHEIRVRSFAALRTAKDLPQAEQEAGVLQGLARSGALDVTPAVLSTGRLLAFLETTDVELIHFIGHGSHTAGQADESGIRFPDGSVLRPADLQGPVATRIGKLRPLIFLNACWAGQQGWSWTRLGGWAARCVGICGCGSFVAPLWPVRDQAALAFAWAFYDALVRGCTLGEAALAARRHVREGRRGDPSVLAYTVYGYPNARLRLGGEATAMEEAGQRPVLSAGLPPPRPDRFRSLRPRKAVVTAASIALSIALTLRIAAGPVIDLWIPMDQVPAEPLLRPTPEKAVAAPSPSPSPTRSPTPPPPPPSTAAIGGLSFEVTGGQSTVNSALKRALRDAARPLTEEGISGWTISLRLDRPQITDNADMKMCRLTAEASARGASRIDLDPITIVNSQYDGALACEAATGPLAEAVLTRFVEALPSQ